MTPKRFRQFADTSLGKLLTSAAQLRGSDVEGAWYINELLGRLVRGIVGKNALKASGLY